MALAEELQRLAPFGRGNPGVSLMLAEARFCDARAMGEGKHVRFTVESRGARARAVAFGGGASLPVEEGVLAEATFKLEVNEWNGVSEPRLVLRHAMPAQAAIEIRPLTAREPEKLAPAHAPNASSGRPSVPRERIAAVAAPEQDEQLELALFAAP
jgi:hypothetical protein